MPYLIQAEEREISYELFEQLARIIDESPVLTYADATSELHHGHGILHFEDKAEAERLLTRFNAIGFRCFLLEKLLEIPTAEDLHLPAPKLDPPPELVIALSASEEAISQRLAVRNRINIASEKDAGLFNLFMDQLL